MRFYLHTSRNMFFHFSLEIHSTLKFIPVTSTGVHHVILKAEIPIYNFSYFSDISHPIISCKKNNCKYAICIFCIKTFCFYIIRSCGLFFHVFRSLLSQHYILFTVIMFALKRKSFIIV